MKKIALFPGSFDPFTLGHESIVRRGINLFDEIIIAVGKNTGKENFFPIDQRLRWINDVFREDPRIRVEAYEGLTVDFCRKCGAGYILRGLRTAADFEYERAIAQVNRAMESDIEVVFMLTLPEHTFINSTLVRDVIRYGGDASKFLPSAIKINKKGNR